MRSTIATITAALLLTGAGAAVAAPPSAEVLDLTCDNGHAYSIWTNGNGAFTPGHLVGEPGVLMPIAFLEGGATAVTPGWQCPSPTTAIPATKSRYERPASSQTRQPSPRTTVRSARA